jgi:hypothetical protein
MGENGGSKARISKAQQAFNQLGGIWRINVVSADKKVKICNCTIKSVLLKPGKLTKRQRRNCKPSKASHKGRCWLDKISNIELWNKTKQEPVETTVKRRKWNMLRKLNDNIVREALEHQPVGQRKKGKPLYIWRITPSGVKGHRQREGENL